MVELGLCIPSGVVRMMDISATFHLVETTGHC
jgi:hypothetical protein